MIRESLLYRSVAGAGRILNALYEESVFHRGRACVGRICQRIASGSFWGRALERKDGRNGWERGAEFILRASEKPLEGGGSLFSCWMEGSLLHKFLRPMGTVFGAMTGLGTAFFVLGLGQLLGSFVYPTWSRLVAVLCLAFGLGLLALGAGEGAVYRNSRIAGVIHLFASLGTMEGEEG